ncbi:MAG: hypothetical protein ACK44L_03685 [Burkholderiales bacterium]|jgi:hypothetical protein
MQCFKMAPEPALITQANPKRLPADLHADDPARKIDLQAHRVMIPDGGVGSIHIGRLTSVVQSISVPVLIAQAWRSASNGVGRSDRISGDAAAGGVGSRSKG